MLSHVTWISIASFLHGGDFNHSTERASYGESPLGPLFPNTIGLVRDPSALPWELLFLANATPEESTLDYAIAVAPPYDAEISIVHAISPEPPEPTSSIERTHR